MAEKRNASTSDPDERLVTVPQAADMLCVSERFVNARLATGVLHRVKLGRATRIRRSEVIRLMHDGVA